MPVHQRGVLSPDRASPPYLELRIIYIHTNIYIYIDIHIYIYIYEYVLEG